MDLELSGKGFVCSGAAGGIGRATARLLAEQGAELVLVDRDREAVNELASALPGSGHRALGLDLRDPDSTAAIGAAARELADPAGLVHLAAVLVPREFDQIDAELWDLHQEVNVRASFLLAREVAAAVPAGRAGAIVLASSGAWLSGGRPERLPYAVTKGAVTTMVRGLARTLGPRGIRVNGLAPGMVDTEMMTGSLAAGERERLEAEVPLGRFAHPKEVASVAAFLLSPAAGYVTGATVAVTGGHVLH